CGPRINTPVTSGQPQKSALCPVSALNGKSSYLSTSAQMYLSCHKCVTWPLYQSAELGNRRSSMRRLIVGSILLCGWATSALAQFSDNKIVIGVMGDQSGVVADVGGPGSILAARMAVEDSGGTAGGVPIEIITADHQNKPDVASAIAREWFD